MTRVIEKARIADLLARLEGHEIYGPVEEDGVVLYRRLDDGDTVDLPLLEFGNSRMPPKSVFFPQTETMFVLEKDDTGHRFVGAREPEGPVWPMILLGVRPCDARAAVLLDRLFTWDYVDPYYMEKRKRATVVSFACTGDVPDGNCFCTSMGGDPAGTEGADMLWTDIGDRFVVEILTAKGEALLEAGSDVFAEATAEDEAAAARVRKDAASRVTRALDREGVVEALEGLFDSPYWDEVAARCLGCGICTLLCPTCHCFDINDVLRKGEGRRERTWDSCQFEYYTVHASGHNPRPAKRHRQRNRIYHKFLYIDRNLDVVGCVGCGRCIANCPVDIDITEVVEGARARARAGAGGESATGAKEAA